MALSKLSQVSHINFSLGSFLVVKQLKFGDPVDGLDVKYLWIISSVMQVS